MGSGQRRMGCPNAVSMLRLPEGSLATPAMVYWTQLGAWAATADPRCCCLRDSLAACKRVGQQTTSPDDDPGAHGMNRGKATLNRGKLLRAVGMAGKEWQQAHSLQNKALQANTAGGLSARHRPQRHNGQQLAGLAAKQQLPTKLAGLSPCSAG